MLNSEASLCYVNKRLNKKYSWTLAMKVNCKLYLLITAFYQLAHRNKNDLHATLWLTNILSSACDTNCDKQNCNHTTGECIAIKQVPTLYYIEKINFHSLYSLYTAVPLSQMNENKKVMNGRIMFWSLFVHRQSHFDLFAQLHPVGLNLVSLHRYIFIPWPIKTILIMICRFMTNICFTYSWMVHCVLFILSVVSNTWISIQIQR